MKKIFRNIFLGFLFAGCLLAALNAEYLGVQLRFMLFPSESDEVLPRDSSGQPLPLPADTLVIESLGIRAPIVYPEKNDPASESRSLALGVAHYAGTAYPGQAGNVYIYGHSSDLPWSKGKFKTVFALLPKIELNARIIASDHEGNAFNYRVIYSHVSDAGDTSVLEQDTSRILLTLQTSYPLGTAWKRWVVQAELVR